MAWQHIRILRFGGPEVLELAEQPTIPDPGPGEVRIKVLAAGTGFTDTFIRRGRYPDFKGPLPFTPGYDLVGVVEETGPGVPAQLAGQLVADLCVVGGYAQYAIRPARFLVPVPDGVDPAEAVCIPLAYLTAYQMLTRYRRLSRGATILVIGASGTVGTALLDLARHRDRHLLGHQRGYGRALRRNGDRLSRRRFRRGCARANRKAQGRGRRRCNLRRDWRRAFRAVFRLPRTRRPTRRLRCPDDGSWRRKLGVSGTRFGAAQTVERTKRPVRRPSRRVLQHHLTPISTPRRFQGRHGPPCSTYFATAPSIP
jgi:hypothetical protein